MEDAQAWAHRCFGSVGFGDVRLNRRAVALAAQLAERPGASICGSSRTWADAKGAYRLLSNPKVGSQELMRPHQDGVREQCMQEGQYLLIEDTSELDFTSHADLEGVGWVGNGGGRGIMMHSTLCVGIGGWRDLDAGKRELEVRVAAAPADGAANAEVVALLAKLLGLAKRDVEIVGGETSRHKRVRLGISIEELNRRLRR